MNVNRTARSLHDRTFLITGAAGFIGTRLVKLLLEIDCRIIRVGRSPLRAGPEFHSRRVEDVCADLGQDAPWGRWLRDTDRVFHLAAQTSSRTADRDPRQDWLVNVVPFVQLLEASRSMAHPPAILLAGTVTQAGIPERIPVDESHPDRPESLYDVHKLFAETYLETYVRRGWARGATLRLANVYGPGPRSGSTDRGVLNRMIQRALHGEPLTVYGSGEFLRDYVFVDDVSEAFLAAAAAPDSVNGRHFVIGSGRGVTIAEAARLVAQLCSEKTGRDVEVRFVEPPRALTAIDSRNFVADSRRFSEIAGWHPRVSLEEGIRRTIDFYQAGEG